MEANDEYTSWSFLVHLAADAGWFYNSLQSFAGACSCH
jgi:hypothetical protein